MFYFTKLKPMKTKNSIFIVLLLLAVSCGQEKNELLLGKWDAQSYSVLNWEEFESSILADAEHADVSSSSELLAYIEGKELSEERLAKIKEERISELHEWLVECQNYLKYILDSTTIEYTINKSDVFTYKVFSKADDELNSGIWSINANGSKILQTSKWPNPNNFQVRQLTKDTLKIEGYITPFNMNEDIGTNAIGHLNLMDYLHFEIKYSLSLLKRE